jgi:Leucine-rich repeat (LRR) protein
LDFYNNKIETIEANAFQHLPKLKWISFFDNRLRSLPQQLFKNNPELILIWLHSNQINSITPDFFKNLNKLQLVGFENNQCTRKLFGCWSGSCSVTQSQLDSGLSTCYGNCRNNEECASQSGNLDNLSSEQIEKNLDLIVASGHTSILTQECDAEKFEKISRDLRALTENSQVQQETIEKLGIDLTLLVQVHDSELKSLKQELAELKTKMEENNKNLKLELGEIFKKEFDAFINKVNGVA